MTWLPQTAHHLLDSSWLARTQTPPPPPFTLCRRGMADHACRSFMHTNSLQQSCATYRIGKLETAEAGDLDLCISGRATWHKCPSTSNGAATKAGGASAAVTIHSAKTTRAMSPSSQCAFEIAAPLSDHSSDQFTSHI